MILHGNINIEVTENRVITHLSEQELKSNGLSSGVTKIMLVGKINKITEVVITAKNTLAMNILLGYLMLKSGEIITYTLDSVEYTAVLLPDNFTFTLTNNKMYQTTLNLVEVVCPVT